MFGFIDKKEFADLKDENELLKVRIAALEEEQKQSNEEHSHLVEDMSSNTTRYRHQEELNHLWLKSSTLVEQIREEFASSSEQLIVHRDSFESSQQLFDEIMTMLSGTISTTAEISSDTSNASESVDQLKTVTSGINDFVNIIKGISDQTNLLALNAAIEAARAGEQGRGFAVVADEVRTLAQRSAEASNEISSLIEQVNQQMGDVINGIQHVGEKSGEISASTASIEDTASSIVNLSQQMYGVITNSTADAFIQTVKMDHVVWKLEVYQVMMGMSDKTADDFVDHTMCRLGKWYYQGEGAEKHANHQAFKRLEKPHALVHTHGLNALIAMKQGDEEQTIKELSIMEAASFDVAEVLTQLSHDMSAAVL